MINYNFNITKSIIRDIIKFKKKINMLLLYLPNKCEKCNSPALTVVKLLINWKNVNLATIQNLVID